MTIKLEAASRLRATTPVHAAPITHSVSKKFLQTLYKKAGLNSMKGLDLRSSEIEGFVLKAELPKILNLIKKAGFTKEWDPREGANTIGLACKDGTWPVIFTMENQGGGEYHVVITNHTHDTIDKGEKKLDIAGFKKISKDVCALLGVKGTDGFTHNNSFGYTVDVGQQATVVKLTDALQKLKKTYGKADVSTARLKSGSTTKVTYKIGYASLVLRFSQKELYSISVEAYV